MNQPGAPEEAGRRVVSHWVIYGALAAVAVVAAPLMFWMGLRAWEMPMEQRELIHLMHERTKRCAEGWDTYDPTGCQKATDAVRAFEKKQAERAPAPR